MSRDVEPCLIVPRYGKAERRLFGAERLSRRASVRKAPEPQRPDRSNWVNRAA